jgi:hypothetical protein
MSITVFWRSFTHISLKVCPLKMRPKRLVSYSRPFVNVNVDDRHRRADKRAEHAEKHHDREQR